MDHARRIEPAPSPDAPGTVAGPGVGAAWYGLGALIVAATFSLVVRSLFGLQSQALKEALGLSDTQLGALSGLGLTLATFVASFPISWLADRSDRRRLLAVCIVAWSAATAACGAARSFPELLACSAGIGVAEAVLNPIGYSLVADLFPRRLWIVANYVNTIASLLGASIALAAASFVIAAIDTHHDALPAVLAGLPGWRLSFVAAALPGPLVAGAILLIRKTAPPARDAADRAGVVAFLRRNARTAAGIFVGYGLIATGLASAQGWAAPAAIRLFHEPARNAGYRLALVSGIASLTGVALSAVIARRRNRHGPAALLDISGLAALAGAGCAALYPIASAAWQLYLVVGLVAAVTFAGLSVSPTILQLIAPRHIRARVITLGGMFYVLLSAFGPVAVGGLSDALPGERGLLVAVAVIACPCFVGGGLLLRLARPTLAATLADAAREDGA